MHGVARGPNLGDLGRHLAPPIASTRKLLKLIDREWVSGSKTISVGKMTVAKVFAWTGCGLGPQDWRMGPDWSLEVQRYSLALFSLWLTRSLLSPCLRLAAQQVTNGCFIHSGSLESCLLLIYSWSSNLLPPLIIRNACIMPLLLHHHLLLHFLSSQYTINCVLSSRETNKVTMVLWPLAMLSWQKEVLSRKRW